MFKFGFYTNYSGHCVETGRQTGRSRETSKVTVLAMEIGGDGAQAFWDWTSHCLAFMRSFME